MILQNLTHSLGWSGTHCVAQADCKAILLCQPSKGWDSISGSLTTNSPLPSLNSHPFVTIMSLCTASTLRVRSCGAVLSPTASYFKSSGMCLSPVSWARNCAELSSLSPAAAAHSQPLLIGKGPKAQTEGVSLAMTP